MADRLTTSSFNSARRRLAEQIPEADLPDELDEDDLPDLERCESAHPDYPDIKCSLIKGNHYQGKHGFLLRWPQED